MTIYIIIKKDQINELKTSLENLNKINQGIQLIINKL